MKCLGSIGGVFIGSIAVAAAFVLLLPCCHAAVEDRPELEIRRRRHVDVRGMIEDERQAEEWLRDLDRRMEEVLYELKETAWNYNVNLTEHNNQLHFLARQRESNFVNEVLHNASLFNWKNFKDGNLIRQFQKISDLGVFRLYRKDLITLIDLRTRIQFIYNTAEVCDPPLLVSAVDDWNRTCFQQDPDLKRIVANSRNWQEQLWAWKGWRDNTGKKMRFDYIEMVRLMKKGLEMSEFRDSGELWRSVYETVDFTEICEKTWLQVKPLYQQLHSYVRRRLMENYPQHAKDFPSSRHIPAHLTGNMWAHSWDNIWDLVIPFKNDSTVDITRILKARKFDARKMFQEADAFFTSLGLHPVTPEFWNRSMIEKPTDGRKVVCHASAWDFSNKRDFRIKQCTDVTDEYFATTHHEMGHIQYYMLYRNQPVFYREGANPGFHEAVGDVIALSVNTPQHLYTIGLIDELKNTYESNLNFLMKQALGKVAFLPYGYLLDRWRWGVFDGTISPKNLNRKYWDFRCELQGISPPIPRSEEDFDPGAKFHVPSNTPYIRYFISHIIQFQFHKSLCEAAGHRGPLHQCDIYNSTAAGDKLRQVLSLGSSKPWPEAMKVLTGQGKMDAGPLLEYFQPLHDWLKKENEGHQVTWDENCPSEAFVSSKMAHISVPLCRFCAMWFHGIGIAALVGILVAH